MNRLRERRGAGFTLMEMLVTLVLVAFATMLMFQMLGAYRVSNERVQAQAGRIDRQSLFQAWFRDSVHGLYAAPQLKFVGDAEGFTATTLNPLYAPEGSPMRVGWTLRQPGGDAAAAEQPGWEIAYSEDGRERWQQPLESTTRARFVYIDAHWNGSDQWPPKLGTVNDEALPMLVTLVREDGDGEQQLVAAVLGPLVPPRRLFGEEELE